MISNLLIQIIHYSKLVDRKEFIDNLFEKESLDISYILDFDRENIDIALSKYSYIKNESQFLAKIKTLWKIFDEEYRVLSDAELSCYFKHLKSLNNISNSNKEFGLILEDDVINIGPIKNNLKKIIKKFGKKDWDVIFLGRGSGNEFINQNQKKIF